MARADILSYAPSEVRKNSQISETVVTLGRIERYEVKYAGDCDVGMDCWHRWLYR